MLVLFLLAPTLGWQIAGVIVAAIGVGVGIWVRFAQKTEGRSKIGMQGAAKRPIIHVSFFPQGTGAAELTNLGPTGVAVNSMLVTWDGRKNVAPEVYPLTSSLSLLPKERKLVYLRPYVLRYFETYVLLLYKTGVETQRPKFHIAFRCEAGESHFDTNCVTILGLVRDSSLVDLGPEA